jgi:hypothetical protein
MPRPYFEQAVARQVPQEAQEHVVNQFVGDGLGLKGDAGPSDDGPAEDLHLVVIYVGAKNFLLAADFRP